MIHYLKHSEIDKPRWDACIRASTYPLIYGYSWYLDLVCDDWDALVLDDYTAVFPLTHRRKFGFRYLYQPDFAQQLGPFYVAGVQAPSTDAFLDAIPKKFRLVEICLNTASQPGETLVQPRPNYELSLADPYDVIAGRYAQNLKRNLKKSGELGLYIAPHADAGAIIHLFRSNRGAGLKQWDDNVYLKLRRVYHALEHKGMARSWGVYNPANELIAGAMLWFDERRITLIFSGLSEEGKEKGAMPLLIDHLVQQFAGTDMTLDFEGSMDPGLARFYGSFGAVEKMYWFYSRYRIPIPMAAIRWLKGNFRG